MSGHDILIGLGVTAFVGFAWLICEILRAPIGFETWHGLRIGTPTNNPVDEHAKSDNFGFEAGAFHAAANTHREQHDHG